jgi:transposase
VINATLKRVGPVTDVESVRIGSLALAFPMLERMKVAEIINRYLPGDPQLEFDYGRVLSLLVAARFYQPVALENVAHWATESGAELLWNIPADKLNDDRLARALDAFFTRRHSILGTLALFVAEEFGVPLRDVHYDPTHIVFQGLYKNAQERDDFADEDPTPIDDDLPPAHITRGRPLEDVPDGARVIHAGLCLAGDQHGLVPLFGHTVSGNENGHTAVAEQWSLLQQVVQPPPLTFFSDTGTFSFGHLDRLRQAGSHGVCPAPWEDFQKLYDEQEPQLTWREASYLSLEQQRRRRQGNLPKEHYELAEVAHTLTDSKDKTRTLAVRVLFVYSTADEKAVRQQRARLLDRREAKLKTLAERVLAGRHPYTKEPRIWEEVEKILGKGDTRKFLPVALQRLSRDEQRALPPPKSGCVRSQHRLVVTRDVAAIAAAEYYDGLSVIITTAPRERTADDLFAEYKRQTYNEHANHVFKGPLAVSPVFLKTPARAEALVFLMMISLMLYLLLQREYRRNVPADAPAKERRVTSKTLLRWFANYTVLLSREGGMRVLQPTRLNARRREALERLGLPTPSVFLRRYLDRWD